MEVRVLFPAPRKDLPFIGGFFVMVHACHVLRGGAAIELSSILARRDVLFLPRKSCYVIFIPYGIHDSKLWDLGGGDRDD